MHIIPNKEEYKSEWTLDHWIIGIAGKNCFQGSPDRLEFCGAHLVPDHYRPWHCHFYWALMPWWENGQVTRD